MKLLIITDRQMFDGKKREYIEISGRGKPINKSSKKWRMEEYFDKGYWALCRKIDKDKIAEFRFSAKGMLKEIKELKGIIWLGDEKYEVFPFSALEMEIVKL